jgi:hypothetical protein
LFYYLFRPKQLFWAFKWFYIEFTKRLTQRLK